MLKLNLGELEFLVGLLETMLLEIESTPPTAIHEQILFEQEYDIADRLINKIWDAINEIDGDRIQWLLTHQN